MIFGLVTTLYNANDLIERTLVSVFEAVKKSNHIKLNYVIKDAESSDGSLSLVKKICEEYSYLSNVDIKIVSSTDGGMYEGISEGFSLINKSDYYGYINAGDKLSVNCFNIIERVTSEFKFDWFTGLDCIYNELGELIYTQLPYKYNNNLLSQGFYGDFLPFVQQESTFWSYRLHSLIDWTEFESFKYAGDFYLWNLFSQHSSLNIIEYLLGGFSYHEGQLSSVFAHEYREETGSISNKKTVFARIHSLFIKIAFFMPNRMKRKLNKNIVSDMRKYLDE